MVVKFSESEDPMAKQLISLFLSVFTAASLLVACQPAALDEIIDPNPQEPEIVPERTTIPYSLKVSTETTRAAYDETANSYSFKTGDKLQVKGLGARTDIEGELTQNGTDWSGTLSYLTSKGDPAKDNPLLEITLIHADNPDTTTYATALVGSAPQGTSLLKHAVENYSKFKVRVPFGDHAGTLSQQAAFLDVTVVFDFDGSRTVEAGKALVDLKIGELEIKKEAAFVEKPDSGGEDFYTNFIVVVPGGMSTDAFTITVGDRKIEFSSVTTLVSNKKYTVSRTIEYRPQLGDPFWSDGTYGRLRHADSNASIVGIIVYVNNHNAEGTNQAIDDAITEKSAGFGHGLVMALRNVAECVPWSESQTTTSCTGKFIEKPTQTMAVTNLSGYANTNSIVNTLQGVVSAASRAKNYDVTVSTSNTSGWFLPSIGQWMYTISTDGFGGANPSSAWINGNHDLWLGSKGTLNDLIYVMDNQGGSQENLLVQFLNNRLELLKTEFQVDYDAFGMSQGKKFADNYWSSSEGSANTAIRMNFGSVEPYNNQWWATIKVKPEPKNATSAWTDTFILKVRPFLAF